MSFGKKKERVSSWKKIILKTTIQTRLLTAETVTTAQTAITAQTTITKITTTIKTTITKTTIIRTTLRMLTTTKTISKQGFTVADGQPV